MSHHIVAINNLTYCYPDGTNALSNITLKITHGESVAIVGANGAGKSTILLHLSGVLLPTEGEIRIGDFPLMRQTISSIRRSVGMIFQNPDDQLFMPTVFDDVAFGLINMGFPTEEVGKKVIEALQTVGAEHLVKKAPYKLSGGEKRAVSIACVLAMSPDILVLDEPSSGLDPQARRRLINLLKGFMHTKIIATHDLDMAYDLCKRVIVLSKGRVIADGPVDSIFNDEELLSNAHLEKPFCLQIKK